MDYKSFFIEQLRMLLNEDLSRSDVANRIAIMIPIDTIYGDDEELMKNCEWGLRHVNEPDFYTTKGELEYYLSCLMEEREYSNEDRDKSA